MNSAPHFINASCLVTLLTGTLLLIDAVFGAPPYPYTRQVPFPHLVSFAFVLIVAFWRGLWRERLVRAAIAAGIIGIFSMLRMVDALSGVNVSR